MSKPPWSILSTKRKSNSSSSTPASRKRQRVSVGEGTSNTARRKSQQTLTQAQWMQDLPPREDETELQQLDEAPPQNVGPARRRVQQTLTQAQWMNNVPPTYDEAELQPLSEERPPLEIPKRRRRPTLKPQDSTLTQMAFFNNPQDDYDFDDAMIEAGESQPQSQTLPQTDGTYDSPRKPRKRKVTSAVLQSSTKRRSAPESQEEYRPSLKKSKNETLEIESPGSTKRKSRRLAETKVLSDPIDNLNFFSEALAVPTIELHNGAAPQRFKYQLEVKDSTEDLENALPEEVPVSLSSIPPQTPKRPPTIVLSSQSPEELPASTRRTKRKLFATPTRSQRTPLAERSTNTLLRTSPRTTVKRHAFKDPSPKRKVIVLKLSKRTQDRRSARVENSQTNLWSVPSSSPDLSRKPPTLQQQSIVTGEDPELEIPATSQAQANVDSSTRSQKSLPCSSLGDLTERHIGEDSREPLPVEAEGIIVRDFADIAHKSLSQDSRHEEPAVTSSPPVLYAGPPEQDLEFDEEAMELGSPVANDTQFNIQVQHRVSSPAALERSRTGMGTAVDYCHPSTPIPRSVSDVDVDGLDADLPDIERIQSSQSPISVPKLIDTSSIKVSHKRTELDDDDTGEVPLPRPVFVHPGSIQRTSSTQVPLNDACHASSSPRFRPTRSNTQKSVHPASMPHPSQMSTQDPTQTYIPPSSLPQHDLDEISERPEKITIKDSNSSSVPMSQIPRHLRGSQARPDAGVALDEEFEFEEEDDFDFDLDPASLPSPQPSQDPRPQITPVQPPPGHIRTSKESQMTTPASTATPACPSPEARHSDLTNDSVPLRESQMTDADVPMTPEKPPPARKQYSPIPGFNNDTQSNFTQNGHVTAAFIHRGREAGRYPMWFIPQPYQVKPAPGYTRR